MLIPSGTRTPVGSPDAISVEDTEGVILETFMTAHPGFVSDEDGEGVILESFVDFVSRRYFAALIAACDSMRWSGEDDEEEEVRGISWGPKPALSAGDRISGYRIIKMRSQVFGERVLQLETTSVHFKTWIDRVKREDSVTNT